MLWTATCVIIFYFLNLQVIALSPLDNFNGKTIAIIGGGPVGLYTACRISEEFHNTAIEIFEKRAKYTRDQEVSLSGWHIPLKNSPLMKGNHPIRNVESLLKDVLSRHFKILFHTWEFTDIDSLVNKFYKTRKLDVIIFANGAKTTAREKYFGGSDVPTKFANAMSVYYQRAPGLKSTGLSYADTYRISKLINAQLFQALKDQNNVRLLVIGPFTKTQFLKKMNAVINARRVELGEQPVSAPTTAFFNLQFEIAKKFQASYGNTHLYLIGDAAASLPYQLGLNAGLYSAEILVKDLRNYGANARKFIGRKKLRAKVKNLASEYFQVFLKINSMKPWQLMTWNENYNQLLLTNSDYTSNYILQHEFTRNRKDLSRKARKAALRKTKI